MRPTLLVALSAGPFALATFASCAPDADRPVVVHVPPAYDPAEPAPLVLMLHAYAVTSVVEERYLDITREADRRGFLYAHPDGTKDGRGNPYWNATDGCCAFGRSPADDSTYLHDVIADIESRFRVDPKRVFLVGHSNGAFMSYRMACDHADQIAGVASLAGAMWEDASKCEPSEPVAVLEIHGTADAVVPYDGGELGGARFPGARTSVADWAVFDGCGPSPASSAPIDVDSALPGNETTVSRYAACAPGAAAELWTVTGGSHFPALGPTFLPRVFDFLDAHSKP